MADNGGGGNSVGIVAIFVIFLIVVAAVAVFVFRGRIFNRGTNVNVTITAPSR
jgi:cell division protein FtsX